MNESEQQAEQEALKDEERPECICGLIAEAFKGPMRWLVVLVWLWGVAFTVVAIWSAVKFFYVRTVRDMILCATVFLASVMIIMLVKLWCWMWMMRGSVMRRIDRLCR